MSTITIDDLNRAADRIEKKIDHRFDLFEEHFDETMTAIRETLDEIAEPQRQRFLELATVVRELAAHTDTHLAKRVTALLEQLRHPAA